MLRVAQTLLLLGVDIDCRLRWKCDGTRAETRFRLSRETDESI